MSPVAHLLTGRRTYALFREALVLGRHVDCDIYDAFTNDGRASRRHSRIQPAGDAHQIEDLGSRNGTWVNDRKIDGTILLRDGDRIRIGDVEFTYQRAGAVEGDSSQGTSSSAQATIVDSTDDSFVVSKVDLSEASQADAPSAVSSDRKLRALVQLLGEIGGELEEDALLEKLLAGLLLVFPGADRCFLGLREADDSIVSRATKFREGGQQKTMPISRTVLDEVVNTRTAVLSADALADMRFHDSQSVQLTAIRSLMCTPLIDGQDRVLGVIQVDALGVKNRFTEDDLEVLASLAPHVTTALQNSRLHEDLLRRQLLDRDLELARRVQYALLPEEMPQVEGFQFFSFYEAAWQVGGDYYEFVPLAGGRWAVIVADAAGKGVSAALLMAKLAGELKLYLSLEPTLAAAIGRMNHSLATGALIGRFVTLVAAVIEPSTGGITLVNAGHCSPLLRRAGQDVAEIAGDIRGAALGIITDQDYREHQLQLAPGDTLALFTDGITEAMNEQQQPYGEERLQERLESAPGELQRLGRHVIDDVTSFVGEQPQSDDICLVIVQRLAEA